MRKSAVILLILVCFLLVAQGQKVRYGQAPPQARASVAYPLAVHISGVHVRSYCGSSGCADAVYADALMNGKKIDLRCEYDELPLGDYQARLKKNKLSANPTAIDQKYELRLPDGTTRQCRVAGYSE